MPNSKPTAGRSTRCARLAQIATACALILPSLAMCGTASPPGDFCLIYQPVYTRAGDTPETRDQVDANNVVWLRCPGVPQIKN